MKVTAKVLADAGAKSAANVARFKFELEIGSEVGYTVLGADSLFLVHSPTDMWEASARTRDEFAIRHRRMRWRY